MSRKAFRGYSTVCDRAVPPPPMMRTVILLQAPPTCRVSRRMKMTWMTMSVSSTAKRARSSPARSVVNYETRSPLVHSGLAERVSFDTMLITRNLLTYIQNTLRSWKLKSPRRPRNQMSSVFKTDNSWKRTLVLPTSQGCCSHRNHSLASCRSSALPDPPRSRKNTMLSSSRTPSKPSLNNSISHSQQERISRRTMLPDRCRCRTTATITCK